MVKPHWYPPLSTKSPPTTEVKALPNLVKAWWVPIASPKEELDVPKITKRLPKRKWDQLNPQIARARRKTNSPQAREYKKVEKTAKIMAASKGLNKPLLS